MASLNLSKEYFLTINKNRVIRRCWLYVDSRRRKISIVLKGFSKKNWKSDGLNIYDVIVFS